MRYTLYIVFGLAIVGGYGFMAARGIEPFGASSEVRTMPQGTPGRPGTGTGRGGMGTTGNSTGSGRTSRSHWYGGFHGGK